MLRPSLSQVSQHAVLLNMRPDIRFARTSNLVVFDISTDTQYVEYALLFSKEKLDCIRIPGTTSPSSWSRDFNLSGLVTCRDMIVISACARILR